MHHFPIETVFAILKKEAQKLDVPLITFQAISGTEPFQLLIATVLSLRTKDETTSVVAEKLFKKLKKPEDFITISQKELEKLLYPVGFYKRKSQQIKEICKIVIEKYDSEVPADLEKLLSLPGVGRKTANLVLAKGFNIPAICVDIHVHRISNRLGFVKTKTPEETEMVLRKKLPKKYWIEYNDVLVAYGQGLCRPQSPWCSKCKVIKYCKRVGVTASR